ncbi:hypothetical protein ABB37_09648 [Leptomonas pyrrhocoris]|uniref:EF-hand domain-containing protein n=1 Tax=Leptomonas pyrrhocoris TaxID=157538 RepID=A0A0M9FQ67_LEPPY|nr:hypothetical protein ABB37_09648 [Leptomonas pyrrhocoris]XP_015652185.1 hypothetical protein ABB37_09648 [Leptomonas pyrrhocoris]XP_015652186.1 hypothetical protein ABB37_09648 [Leptomonas pyrrhocoris]XP_015652187.1 hypothetical protein ABB37_09648 [Leptomonas pyrrhocoris]XP_015652188.1 hypothetical protein ABB37_09648 [Leptomonas pyrrhocoris]KPA73745.1 hypothetical protein ABB37_09648 [Leptomonas pyrrhocoris]KPA73746.1 hypothetical protein ABB37_09648 [Leptomonas pyrrhocoris]KPA73747.1 h|eukprot:XP_015652184.1 hypothetical protein ABB37_09648 [Leptomonas pyrrhocoris]
MAFSPSSETPAAPSAAVVGFQTKKVPGMPGSPTSIASITPERLSYLQATLAKLPELDLSEMARVKECFAAVLGEGRENIVNGLELRVVLGDLGLYPSEEELEMVLRASRDRVNLVGLTRYLRLYKKEFWLNQVAASSSAQQQQRSSNTAAGTTATTGSANAGVGVHLRRPFNGANAGSTNAVAAAPPVIGVSHTYTAFSGSPARAGGRDDDTLRAFVALGGEEDGNGEIAAATLRDVVRGFGLTIDIDAMIRTVDVHHSGMLDYVDFCALWAAPAEGSSATSIGNALRQASADAEQRESIEGRGSNAAFTPGGSNRRMLSMLRSPSLWSNMSTGSPLRRSRLLSLGNDVGMSGSTSPRLGAAGAGGGRLPISGDRADGAVNAANAAHNTVTTCAPVLTAALPAPISEEEHALLVRMFLFPDQFESDAAGRRGGGARFMLPPRSPEAGAGHNSTFAGAVNAATASARLASLSQRSHSQLRLSRPRKSGTNAGGRKTKFSQRNSGNGSGDNNGDDLTADFFSPKNQNVYRPPSPMLLSMRNSTAHRNRVKRLEEQKHAARRSDNGSAARQRQQNGLYSATMTRDGGYGQGADGDNASRPAKSSTW